MVECTATTNLEPKASMCSKGHTQASLPSSGHSVAMLNGSSKASERQRASQSETGNEAERQQGHQEASQPAKFSGRRASEKQKTQPCVRRTRGEETG
ncbi:hypothetical protein SRHO_G00157360 [Serrasalmus rhombeus]